MKQIVTALLVLISFASISQVRMFSGTIGKYPIHLVTYSYSDGDTRAIYAYDKHDTPISINGRLSNNTLTLDELDGSGAAVATLELYGIGLSQRTFKGKWISQDRKVVYDILLTKEHEFDSYDESTFDSLEFMQSESTSDFYFKLVLSKSADDDVRVTGVRVYQKRTDKLMQELDLDCQFRGLSGVSVADYNFDGIDDFSVFEASYAGPNTTSVYILRDPNANQFFISEISGVSLEFDAGEKLIHEYNQCCAGTKHMYITYKLVNNKMVEVEKHCYEYNEEKDELVEGNC